MIKYSSHECSLYLSSIFSRTAAETSSIPPCSKLHLSGCCLPFLLLLLLLLSSSAVILFLRLSHSRESESHFDLPFLPSLLEKQGSPNQSLYRTVKTCVLAYRAAGTVCSNKIISESYFKYFRLSCLNPHLVSH